MLNFFQKMLIGYVLIIFDFNVGIDIVPDVIVYFMIAHALTNLKTVKGSKGAFTVAIILGVMSMCLMVSFKRSCLVRFSMFSIVMYFLLLFH